LIPDAGFHGVNGGKTSKTPVTSAVSPDFHNLFHRCGNLGEETEADAQHRAPNESARDSNISSALVIL
jgi:hypothetical protein